MQLRTIHHQIGKEFFQDGNITWSRIITFISFSALLAERVVREQCQNRDLIITSFIDWTTNFIETDLQSWLENEDYWVSDSHEKSIDAMKFSLDGMFENL